MKVRFMNPNGFSSGFPAILIPCFNEVRAPDAPLLKLLLLLLLLLLISAVVYRTCLSQGTGQSCGMMYTGKPAVGHIQTHQPQNMFMFLDNMHILVLSFPESVAKGSF